MNVLHWYTHTPRAKAQGALALLEESLAIGEWLPRASRQVRATLSKSNVAKKAAKKVQLDRSWSDPLCGPLHQVEDVLRFGNFDRAQKIDFAALLAADLTEAEAEMVRTAQAFAADFAPVAAAMALLDATRPAPVFTAVGVSPTLTRTLEFIGLLGTTAETARMCPVKRERIETRDEKGNLVYEYVLRLDPPENTAWHRSRFSRYDSCCEACGHKIKRANNWLLVLVDDAKGTPHALWVGRDCAKSLFGIDAKGELKYIEEDVQRDERHTEKLS